jgi:hypothetical protein
MKSEVYSWRVSTDLKTELEREAQRRRISVSAALDLAAHDWLDKAGSETEGDQEQLRLHKAASKCFGALGSGNRRRSENASQAVRQRLRRHYGR